MNALRHAIKATLRDGRVDSRDAIEPLDMAVLRERRAGLTRKQIAAKLRVDESAVFDSLVRTYAETVSSSPSAQRGTIRANGRASELKE